MGIGFGNFVARNRPRPTNPGRGNRTRTNSGGGRARSHHRLRPRHRRHGRLHRPRPDLARRAPAHDLGTGGLDRLPRHPDRGHRGDGPRHAGTDRRRPGAEDQGRHQRPRAQAEEPVHAHRAELAGGGRGPGEAGDAVGCRQRARQPRSRPPPLRGLRRAHGHELPARPRRGQPHRPRDRPGRQPRQGRHAQAQPLGRAIRAQPRRHRHVRVSNGARRGRPAAASRALPQGRHAARAGPLDRRAPAPAAGGEAAPQTAVFTRRFDARPARVGDAVARTAARRHAASADR